MDNGALDLFENDVRWMLQWAFGVNAMVIIKGSAVLATWMKTESKGQSKLNFTPQEAHAQAAMIMRRIKMLDQADMAIIYGLYDRNNRQIAATAIADWIKPHLPDALPLTILKEMIRSYMGDKGPSIRGYAGHLGVSTGKAFELRKAVFDLCAALDKGAHYKVENLFYQVEGVAA